jgi:methyltransferase (TIGR00027 family)
MREGWPSGTALRVAMRRAAHQVLDAPRVFVDPLALTILGLEEAAHASVAWKESETQASRSLRAFIVVRGIYAENELAQAIERGVGQYVVLGAGLDTFAYRNPYANLQVFEVDHPATLAWNRHRLQEVGIVIPSSLTFAPVDFEKEALVDGLRSVGFNAERASFFSWLGVTSYLTRETVLSTLSAVIAMSRGNGIVFDFAVPRATQKPLSQMAFDALAARVAAAGEPFQGFFEPAELAEQLGRAGCGHVEDLDGEMINSRYFKDRTDGLRVGGGLAHLASARA